ncbi:hypothetical protein [Streptomyces sp. NBC_00076]|uniref:hypothetical protein n=1 Tax=Streptomyces sp. NBC_00076 TaxID=2975642 RepID=UPI0032468E15
MRYIDSSGDTWEDAGDDSVRVVAIEGNSVADSEPCSREAADEMWGPLRPVAEVVGDAEEWIMPLPTVSEVMSRASVFQSAHDLVSGLKWGESESPSVYDVLQVAKWLGEGE